MFVNLSTNDLFKSKNEAKNNLFFRNTLEVLELKIEPEKQNELLMWLPFSLPSSISKQLVILNSALLQFAGSSILQQTVKLTNKFLLYGLLEFKLENGVDDIYRGVF